MMLERVKLRTLGKAAVVGEEGGKGFKSSEPAFNLSIPFLGFSFMGVHTLEYMAPIGQPIGAMYSNAGPMAPERNHWVRGRETSPEARV